MADPAPEQPKTPFTGANQIPDTVPGSHLGKYYCKLSLGPYKRPKPLGRESTWKATKIVYLPLPQELRDDTSVRLNNIDLNTVGDIINGSASGEALFLRQAGPVASKLIGVAGGTISNLVGNKSGLLGSLLGNITNSLQEILPANEMTSALQQGMGVAPNPNASVEFQGPVLRDFSYSWTFYPQNIEESDGINKLIKMLKGYALPASTFALSAAVLNYPWLTQLNFYPWDNDYDGVNHWGWGSNAIIKMKRCFMNSVNVDYASLGTPSFFQNTTLPTHYRLTIGFKEAEYMLAENWRGIGRSERGSALADLAAAVATPFFPNIGFRQAAENGAADAIAAATEAQNGQQAQQDQNNGTGASGPPPAQTPTQ